MRLIPFVILIGLGISNIVNGHIAILNGHADFNEHIHLMGMLIKIDRSVCNPFYYRALLVGIPLSLLITYMFFRLPDRTVQILMYVQEGLGLVTAIGLLYAYHINNDRLSLNDLNQISDTKQIRASDNPRIN
jgi:hypothetical protein